MHRLRDIGLLLLLVALASRWIEQRVQQQARADLKTCKANLARIALACEAYSADNAGLFPRSLDQLGPEYLTSIPTCPVAQSGPNHYQYLQAKNPYCFTLNCQGNNHSTVGEQQNFPQYLNTDGPFYH